MRSTIKRSLAVTAIAVAVLVGVPGTASAVHERGNDNSSPGVFCRVAPDAARTANGVPLDASNGECARIIAQQDNGSKNRE